MLTPPLIMTPLLGYNPIHQSPSVRGQISRRAASWQGCGVCAYTVSKRPGTNGACRASIHLRPGAHFGFSPYGHLPVSRFPPLHCRNPAHLFQICLLEWPELTGTPLRFCRIPLERSAASNSDRTLPVSDTDARTYPYRGCHLENASRKRDRGKKRAKRTSHLPHKGVVLFPKISEQCGQTPLTGQPPCKTSAIS